MNGWTDTLLMWEMVSITLVVFALTAIWTEREHARYAPLRKQLDDLIAQEITAFDREALLEIHEKAVALWAGPMRSARLGYLISRANGKLRMLAYLAKKG